MAAREARERDLKRGCRPPSEQAAPRAGRDSADEPGAISLNERVFPLTRTS